MSKKTTSKFISILLVLLLMCSLMGVLVACKDDDPPSPPEPNTNIQANEYAREIGVMLSNSIDANVSEGFNIDYSGNIGFAYADANKSNDNWGYSFSIQGNILNNNLVGNNGLQIKIANGNDNVLSMWNSGTELCVLVGDEAYRFSDTSIMSALTSFLVLNTDIDATGNIKDIMVNFNGANLTVYNLIKDAMGAIIAELCVDDSIANKKANICITKTDNVITASIDVDKIKNLLADLVEGVDLSFIPSGLKLELSFTSDNNTNADKRTIVGISAKMNMAGADMPNGNFKFDIKSANNGLFAPINNELEIKAPAFFRSIEASSLLQTDFAGTMNFASTNTDGTKKVVRSFDWKFVSKIDLSTLIFNNFMFDKLPTSNFFHFQLSHTCDTVCAEYCTENVASADRGAFKDNYKNTSIIDIAWSPSTMGTNNIVADISLWDILTNNGLDNVLSAVANMSIYGTSDLANLSISSRLVLNLDPNAIMQKDNTVKFNTGTTEEPSEPPVSAEPIDIASLIPKILDMGKIDGDGLSVSLAGMKATLESLLGTDPLVGTLTAGKLVDIIFDGSANTQPTTGKNPGTVDTIIFSGVEGPGSYVKTNFGHFANVADYDTYEKAFKYNVDGITEKMAANNSGLTMYGGMNFSTYKIIKGTPAMYTKGIEMTDGYINFYIKDGDDYKLVADNNTFLTAYEFDKMYANGKDLLVKYTYVSFDKQEYTAYGTPFGYQGLDFNKNEEQNIKLLTSFFTGSSFNQTLQDNIGALLSVFGAGVALPNLETIIPIASDMFDGKIKVVPQHTANSAKLVSTDGDKTTFEATDTIGKFSYELTFGEKKVNIPLTTTTDLTLDFFGYMVSGSYTATHTMDAKYGVTFEDGTLETTSTFTVNDYKSITFIPTVDLSYKAGKYIRPTSYGKVTYTLSNDTTVEIDLLHSKVWDKIIFDSSDIKATRSNLNCTVVGDYTGAVKINDTTTFTIAFKITA